MFIGNDLYRVYCTDLSDGVANVDIIIAVLSTSAQVEAFCASLQYSHDMATISVMYGTDTYKLKGLFNTILGEGE